MKSGYFFIIFLSVAASLAAGVDSKQELRTDEISNEVVSESPIRPNWRKLCVGMYQAQVIKILGQPYRVKVDGFFTIWYYESFGSVSFSRGVVDGWSEPL